MSLLLIGLVVGLVTGIFEELGWTGFAIPRLRLRYGVLTTGLIVGVLWGAWHFLIFWEATLSGALPAGPLPARAALLLAAGLPGAHGVGLRPHWEPARGDAHAREPHGQHADPPAARDSRGAPDLDLVWAAALWVVVAAVAMANRGQLSQQPLRTRVA